MKTITTILLIVTVLGCSAQEPDTIICYDQADIDSKDVLLFDTIDFFEELMADTISYFESLIAFKDSVINNTDCTNELEELQALLVIKDSIISQQLLGVTLSPDSADASNMLYEFKMYDGRSEIRVNKYGWDAEIYLLENDRQTKIEYLNNERTIILTDSILWRP